MWRSRLRIKRLTKLMCLLWKVVRLKELRKPVENCRKVSYLRKKRSLKKLTILKHEPSENWKRKSEVMCKSERRWKNEEKKKEPRLKLRRRRNFEKRRAPMRSSKLESKTLCRQKSFHRASNTRKLKLRSHHTRRKIRCTKHRWRTSSKKSIFPMKRVLRVFLGRASRFL